MSTLTLLFIFFAICGIAQPATPPSTNSASSSSSSLHLNQVSARWTSPTPTSSTSPAAVSSYISGLVKVKFSWSKRYVKENGASLPTLERRCVPRTGSRKTRVWPVDRKLKPCLKRCFKWLVNKDCDASSWTFVSKTPTMASCVKKCDAVAVPMKVKHKDTGDVATLTYYMPEDMSPPTRSPSKSSTPTPASYGTSPSPPRPTTSRTPRPSPSQSSIPYPSPTSTATASTSPTPSVERVQEVGFIKVLFGVSDVYTMINGTNLPQIVRVCKLPGSDGQRAVWFAAEPLHACALQCLAPILGTACNPLEWGEWATNAPRTNFCLVERCGAKEQQLRVLFPPTGSMPMVRYYGAAAN